MKNLSKQDLLNMALPKEDHSKIDFTIPQQWADKCRDMRVDPQYYVWSYLDDRVGGQPFHLLEEIAKTHNSTSLTMWNRFQELDVLNPPSFKVNTLQAVLYRPED